MLKQAILKLAKSAVENYLKKGIIISPPLNLPKELLNKKSGIFVTIKKNNELRGCIGTYLPTKNNIAEEIISNAINAAVNDYRFDPIQPKELNQLSYEVYILDKPEFKGKIQELKELKEDNLRKLGLNPKKYGVLVKSGFKSGLLLPNLEGISKAQDQVLIAAQKGGINPYQEEFEIYCFSAKKYE